ncbi:MAG: DUF2723 domain-containing protein [Chloroflexi bacterium]|nr:DUF2723 domain-containing protein [Chloroflexota bacterium]
MRLLSPTTRARLGRWLPPALVGLAALALYVATAAPGLTWAHDGADGGDLITAALTGGVPHPSGYPTYCLLGRLFAVLPLGNPARRMNLFSAALAAASVTLVFLCARRLLEREGAARDGRVVLYSAGAALAYAVGPTLWSQATIAEVYALAAFCFALCLWLALRAGDLKRTSGHAGRWAALGLALGIGLGGHLTLLLALPGLAILLWPARTPRRLLGLVSGAALGLVVYLYLPLAAARRPLLNWGDPRHWEGFIWLVSGRLYHSYAFGLPLHYLPARLAAWLSRWAAEFAGLGLALAVLGLWSGWERGQRRLVGASLLTLALYSTYALAYNTTDSYVYLLPNYAVTALWLAVGLRALAESGAGTRSARLWRAAALVLALALPVGALAGRYPAMNLRHERETTAWVDSVLAELPSDALLVTGQDRHTFALEYACWVEGRCGAVRVVDGELLGYAWYQSQLLRRYPELESQPPAPTLEALVAQQIRTRRVFIASPRPGLEPDYQAIARGPLWELVAQR